MGPVPVTAKLSRRFYDKLGDDVANELVEWLNTVDTSYRQEFKDLLDLRFGRFESELGSLRAELRGEMRVGLAEVRADMARTEKSLVRWMFGFWIGSWAAMIGTLIAMHQFGILSR